MLVYGAQSYIAASGIDHLCLVYLAEKCSQQIIGCSDLPDIISVYTVIGYMGTVDLNGMTIQAGHLRAHALYGHEYRLYIRYIREILYDNRFIRHYGGSKDRERGVLGARYIHLSDERITAFDNILIHHILININR